MQIFSVHQWLLIFTALGIFIGGFVFYDFLPYLNLKQQLTEQEAVFTKKIKNNLKRPNEIKNKNTRKIVSIAELQLKFTENLQIILHENNVLLKQIFFHEQAKNNLFVRMKLIGKNKNLMNLLMELAAIDYSYEIIFFDYQVQKSRLEIKLHVYAAEIKQSSKDYLANSMDIFSLGRGDLSNTGDFNSQAVSIHDLTYCGYVKAGNFIFGILQWPDLRQVTVHLQDKVGREQAVVMEITAQKLTLGLENHKKMILKNFNHAR